MRFMDKYPVALNELLLAPLVFREGLPCLGDSPFPSASAMRDLAEFGGHGPGAIRTAMSRMRSAGDIEAFADADGATRYRMSASSRAVSRSVLQRPSRPEGFLLAIFSFASGDGHERQVVRDTLRYHGFQKLAQNVYINGRIDTSPLERVFQEQELSDHVFLFHCPDVKEPSLRRRLLALFDVAGRKRVLARFRDDLRGFLEEDGLEDDEFARRFFYVGPVHYRMTFVEEPPLPTSYLPEGYPLAELLELLSRLAERKARALRQYFDQVSSARPRR